ncbi:GDSL-type esterase/lipase family protein [Paenibacillus oryzisoli]|uniref:SGNH/GDSL hydrolase family protein n=1 Tax=Paenibacillus oryzisoli TaxID=1850517 RepID=UPI003D2C5C6E
MEKLRNIVPGDNSRPTEIPPGDSNIAYYGRWDRSDPGYYHSYWGGAYLKVRFTGTSVKINLNKSTSLLVNIDNTGDKLFHNVNGTVNLTPDELLPGTHSIKVAAQYDEMELVFQGLILDPEAETLAPLISQNKIVEFIGDSITTGADNPNGDGDAFAWLASDLLGVEHTQISDPGIALVDGYGSSPSGMETAYFKLKTPNYTTTNSDWDHSTYTPAAIVVNLGSNDHYSNIDPALFQSRYIVFLTNLRGKYPDAEIFGLRLFNGWFETEVQNAVEARIVAGDAKVHYVDTAGWLQGYGTTTTVDYVQKSTGFSVHPSRLGHSKAAKQLVPILKPYLNLPFTQQQYP